MGGSDDGSFQGKDDLRRALSGLTFGVAWTGESGDVRTSDEQECRQKNFPRSRGRQFSGPPGSGKFSGDRGGQAFRGERRPAAGRGRFPRAPRNFHGDHFAENKGDFTVTFYADDEAFQPVAEMIRKSGKTYEVFRVVQTFLAKPERFVFVLRKNAESETKFYKNIFDNIPFSSGEEALHYLLQEHLGKIFTEEEEICKAPRGIFQQIARCPFTKRLIAAPNHHSYKELLGEHYLRYVNNVSFDHYCTRLEFTKEAEDIAAWLEAMKRRVTYRLRDEKDWKVTTGAEEDGSPVAAGCGEVVAGESSQSSEKTIPGSSAEAEGRPKFHSLEGVRAYLEEHRRQFIGESTSVRVPGISLANIRDTGIRRPVEYQLQRQIKFPLDTANAMRNKFKKNHLHVYRRGKKGISYVAAVARKFREADTVLVPELELIITAIEKNPMISLLDLSAKLGLGAKQEAALRSLTWLIREGYVTEFEDGTLLTPPCLPARKEDGGKRAPEEEDVASPESEIPGELVGESPLVPAVDGTKTLPLAESTPNTGGSFPPAPRLEVEKF
ncbi:MAG: hypothetical protein LBS68_00745 [Puniceicoccales bacterium]|nr:hypothetical protein [Puniceicoccales bacterium]